MPEYEFTYNDKGVVVSKELIPCEQRDLFKSLSEEDKYKHFMNWEGITYEGYCKACDTPETDIFYKMEDYTIDHIMHNGTFCTFVSCNCAEPCELRRESR